MIERTLAPGVTLRAVQTSKFKTSMLAVTFLEPLREETASATPCCPGSCAGAPRTTRTWNPSPPHWMSSMG